MFKAYTDTYRGYCGSSYCTGTVTCRTRDTYAHILLFLEKYTLMWTYRSPQYSQWYKCSYFYDTVYCTCRLHTHDECLFQASNSTNSPKLTKFYGLTKSHRAPGLLYYGNLRNQKLVETYELFITHTDSCNCWATDKVWGYMGLHGVTCFSKSGVWIDACCSLGFLAAASAGRPDVQYHTGRRSRKSRVKSNWQQFFKKNDSIIPQKSPLSQNSWKYGFGVS
ncbi:hypothetical protein B0I74DRAFT_171256 [Yarrowia lipolytica]|nr:hypothetical protein B0I74DRAFT_171256 [Yarrowia lipolytica]